MTSLRPHDARLGVCFGLLLTAVAACAVGTDDTSATFGTSATHGSGNTTVPTTSATTMSTDADDDSDDADATHDDDTTGGGAQEGTDTGTAETGEVPIEQPANGMYSACLQASTCVGLTTCFTVTEGNDVVDGFCTRAPCIDPTTDCDPSPGGTSVPICFDMLVGGSPTMGCALDCSGGKTCPGGMQCYSLASGQICI